MEKTYLRYRSSWFAGVMTSSRQWTLAMDGESQVVAAAVRDVVGWDLKTGEKRRVYPGDVDSGFATSPNEGKRGEVVAVATPKKKDAALPLSVAVAYASGVVRAWRGRDDEDRVDFDAKSAPTVLRWSDDDLLAAGCANGDVFVMDVVAKKIAARLSISERRGHRCWDVAFLSSRTLLSVDATLKVWDLDAGRCAATSADVDGPKTLDTFARRVLVAGDESQLRCWTCCEGGGGVEAAAGETNKKDDKTDDDDGKADKSFDKRSPSALRYDGDARRGRPSEACVALRFAASGERFAALTARAVEVYVWRDESEAKRKAKRRAKRQHQASDNDDAGGVRFGDEVELVATVVPKDGPRSFAFFRRDEDLVAVATRRNAIETHRATTKGEATLVRSWSALGHRGPVRSVDLSTDGRAVAAAAATGVKIWSADAEAALHRDLAVGKKVLVVKFVSEAEIVVGADDGRVSVLDVASGDVVVDLAEGATSSSSSRSRAREEEKTAAVWALDVRFPKSSESNLVVVDVVSGGADKRARLYRGRRRPPGGGGSSSTTISWKRGKTLEAGEEILAVKFFTSSSSSRLLTSTMDATIRVYEVPSLKFTVALYGHAMPALCCDAADDVIASAGADKTLKFWGADFGDLRRSTLAHDDAVTALLFLPGTHYLVTASKDGDVKMWDCDRQEPFVQLFKRGHVAEVWALAVKSDGSQIFSAGADRSLRCWARTDEPLVASEEADVLLEHRLDLDDQARFGGGGGREDGAVLVSSGHDGGASSSTTKAADRLAEALDVSAEEDAKRNADPAAYEATNALLMNLPPETFVLHRLRAVPPADLERALLLLPIHDVALLFHFLALHLQHSGPEDVELCARAVNFAVTVHHAAVINHGPLRLTLRTLRDQLRTHLDAHRALFGANLAALRVAKLGLNHKASSS